MIEKGSINWAAVSTAKLEHKPGAEQADRRGPDKSQANWGDDIQGKVAAEIRPLAPGENDGSEKPTHRGDERRRKAETERRNSGSPARRSGENSASAGGGHQRIRERAPEDRERYLDVLPQSLKRSSKITSVRRKKTAAAKSANTIKTSWPDLKSFVSDNFPNSIFNMAMANHYPLEVSRPTALNPLGGGFVWPIDLLPAFEDRVVRR